MTYLENADYFVRLVDLPIGIHGVCATNDDGTFSVFINARNDRDQQIRSYFHERKHIEGDDFYNGKDIREVEGL